VVHYDTTVDSVVSGSTVVDISGNGRNGTLFNGTTYSSTDRALTFDGTDDYVTATLNNPAGAWAHSISFWIQGGVINDKIPFTIGVDGVINDTIGIYITGSGINYYFFANDKIFTYTTNNTTLYHIVATYDGGSTVAARRMWVNGVELITYTTGGTIAALNLGANAPLFLGRRKASSNFNVNGSISNFKLWNVALTAEEVAMEYALGRTGKSINLTDTALCLGGTVPRAQLDVRGSAVFGTHVGINTSSPVSPLQVQCTNNGTSGIRIVRASGNGHWEITNQIYNDLVFSSSNGNGYGYLPNNTNVANIDFTGQHRNFIDGIPYGEYQTLEGLIVSANKNKYYDIDENITSGANAIQISQSLPLVSLSTKEKDKSCFGVISGVEDPEKREYEQGTFVSVVQKQKGDRRAYINSVGEGAMWVTDINGPLESGDYITTSNVAGYGQKQDSEFLANYTVAKITMDCDFDPQDQPIQRIKQSNVVETHYTGVVSVTRGVPHEFVTTTVTTDDEWSNVSISPSDVTYEEWSNLEANVQNTYTLTYTQTSNVVYDVKYTKTTTANVTQSDPWDKVYVDPPNVSYEEWSNLDANVQNTYTLTYTMTTKVEATEAIYSNLSTEDKELFVPTYYQMVEQRVDAGYPGAVKHETVTDRLENALDEHGQLQWEDDPSGATEKAYKIRYLDASGAQTDEANAVHTAAFVGVTYHCG